MLVPPPVAYRRRRRPIKGPGVVVGPLVLVSAAYDGDASTLMLVFDRAIDVSGVVGSAIVVNDGESLYLQLAATGGAVMVDPVTVRLTLESLGDWENPGVVLDAAAGNGIVAAGDGAAWAGAVNVALPWPP